MNFYKITNKDETHNNLQYNTGLNIDTVPFNPSGDCLPGGIYFAIEDILSFLNYGVFVRKVTLPKDAQVYENPGLPKKWKADKVILGKRMNINLKTIKRLVEEGADIHSGYNCAIIWASKYGYLEVVKYLVENGADIHAENDQALRWASKYGHLEVVKYLVEHGADIHAERNYSPIWAFY